MALYNTSDVWDPETNSAIPGCWGHKVAARWEADIIDSVCVANEPEEWELIRTFT